MLAFPHSVRIFVAVQPVDMRKQFNGLWSAASEQLQEDPKRGAVFCFINKERTRLKLLYWDGTMMRLIVQLMKQGSGSSNLGIASSQIYISETDPFYRTLNVNV